MLYHLSDKRKCDKVRHMSGDPTNPWGVPWRAMQTMVYGGSPDPGMPYVPREHVPASPFVTIPGITVGTSTLVLHDPAETARMAVLQELLQLVATRSVSHRYTLIRDAVERIVADYVPGTTLQAFDSLGNRVETAWTDGDAEEIERIAVHLVARLWRTNGPNQVWITADGGTVYCVPGSSADLRVAEKKNMPSPVVASPEPAPKREVTVAARIDEYGQLHLRMSIDGVHLREISMHGSSITFTEKI